MAVKIPLKDLLERKRKTGNAQKAQQAQGKQAEPWKGLSPHRKIAEEMCEKARRLGLIVYAVENQGHLLFYLVEGEDKPDTLLLKANPYDWKLENWRHYLGDFLGNVLRKRGGA